MSNSTKSNENSTSSAVSATVVFTHGKIEITGTPIFVLAKINDSQKSEGFISVEMGGDLETALGTRLKSVALYYSLISAAKKSGIFRLTTDVCRNIANKLQDYDKQAMEIVSIECDVGSLLKVTYLDSQGETIPFKVNFDKVL